MYQQYNNCYSHLWRLDYTEKKHFNADVYK